MLPQGGLPATLTTQGRERPLYWVYYSLNGKAIARSSESYVKRSDCEHSITLVKNSSSHSVFYTE